MDRDAWEMGNKRSRPFSFPSLVPLGSFQAVTQGGSSRKPWWTLWVEHMKLKSRETKVTRDQKTEYWRGKRCTNKDSRDLHKLFNLVPSILLCQTTTQDQANDHLKGLKVIEPHSYKIPVIMLVPKSQNM